jgi:sorbitol-specific phosphotransferase system component IIC
MTTLRLIKSIGRSPSRLALLLLPVVFACFMLSPVAILLNEFLKEHQKVAQQQSTITELKTTVAKQQDVFAAKVAHQQQQIEALAAAVQKVSNQLELNKAAQQVVASNQ